MTPKIIHHYWNNPDGHDGDLPSDVSKNVKAWADYHPGFRSKVWTPQELSQVIANVDGISVWTCVKACRLSAMQSDVVRLALIYLFGGVWNDLKNLPLKPFLEQLILCPAPIFAEHPPMPNRPNPTGYICNAFIISPPGDPFILGCLRQACESITARDESGVFGVTGGGLIMKIKKRFDTGNKTSIQMILEYDIFWNRLVRRTTASYNVKHQHWSVLQNKSSLYVDL